MKKNQTKSKRLTLKILHALKEGGGILALLLLALSSTAFATIISVSDGSTVDKVYSEDTTLSETVTTSIGVSPIYANNSGSIINLTAAPDVTVTIEGIITSISSGPYAVDLTMLAYANNNSRINFFGDKFVFSGVASGNDDMNLGHSGIHSLGNGTVINLCNDITDIYMEKKGGTGNTYGVNARKGGLVYFNNPNGELNIKTISNTISTDDNGSSIGISANSTLNDSSTVRVNLASVDISASSTGKGYSYGILADSGNILFENPDGIIKISADAINQFAAGIGSVGSHGNNFGYVEFKNKTTEVFAKADKDASIGIVAMDGSTIKFSNPLGDVNVLAASSDDVHAYGVYTASKYKDRQNTIIFDNLNTEIIAQSENSLAYSLIALSGGNIFLNAVSEGDNIGDIVHSNATTKLTGDIYSGSLTTNTSKIYANLIGSDSYLRGLIGEANNGLIYMLFLDGATWQIGSKQAVWGNTATNLVFDNAVIDLSWYETKNADAFNPTAISYHDATLNKITLKNGVTYIVNTDIANNTADNLTIDEIGVGSDSITDLFVKIGYDPSIVNAVDMIADTPINILNIGDSNGTALNVKAVTNNITDGLRSYKVTPMLAYTNDNDVLDVDIIGAKVKYGVSDTVQQFKDLASSLVWQGRVLNNSTLTERMGRLSQRNYDQNNNNLWAYFTNASLKYNSTDETSVSQNMNNIHVGVDFVKESASTTRYIGANLNYLTDKTDYTLGKSSTNTIGGNVYGTWINKNGSYLDVIAGINSISGDIDSVDSNDVPINADYNSWGTSISAEYGKDFELGNGFSIVPQAQLSYGHIAGFTANADDYIIKYDNITSAVARVGFDAVKDFGKDKLYISGSVYHDFAKSSKLTAELNNDAITTSGDLIDTWCQVSVGADVKLANNANGYLEASRVFGDKIGNNFKLNAGVRVAF